MAELSFISHLVNVQEKIDFIAFDLSQKAEIIQMLAPAKLAELLEILPEQDVWMYEPDPSDPESKLIFATHRLIASDGTIFHISCQINREGQPLEWIGPYDVKLGHGQFVFEWNVAA